MNRWTKVGLAVGLLELLTHFIRHGAADERRSFMMSGRAAPYFPPKTSSANRSSPSAIAYVVGQVSRRCRRRIEDKHAQTPSSGSGGLITVYVIGIFACVQRYHTRVVVVDCWASSPG
jgi:hypothetical protein